MNALRAALPQAAWNPWQTRLIRGELKFWELHSPPLLKKDLVPVRDYYQRMLTEMRADRGAGWTFAQAKASLDKATFPVFRDTPPGVWSHGMHERNLWNLWRLVPNAAEPQPKVSGIHRP